MLRVHVVEVVPVLPVGHSCVPVVVSYRTGTTSRSILVVETRDLLRAAMAASTAAAVPDNSYRPA